MIRFLIFYTLIHLVFGGETSIEKLNKFGGSILESYWESYAGLPYGTDNCRPENLTPYEQDQTDYAIRLNQIPSDSIDIINIAYASVDWFKYNLLSYAQWAKICNFDTDKTEKNSVKDHKAN